MKKNKYTSDQLYEWTITTTEINCSKCKKTNTLHLEQFQAMETFFEIGWRATPSNVYCPDCTNKHLKKS